MNSERQRTIPIVGSVAGTVVASTIAIATLIVTQMGRNALVGER